MEILEIVVLAGIGAILLTYIIMLIINHQQILREKRDSEKMDNEWRRSPDYYPPPKPPLITKNPSIRMRW